MKNSIGRSYRYLLIVSGTYSAAVAAVILTFGGTLAQFFHVFGFYLTASVLYVFCLVAVILSFVVQAFWRARWRGGMGKYLNDIVQSIERQFDDYVKSGMMKNAFLGLASVVPVLTFFSMGKSLLGHAVPYRWDPLLEHVDRVIHFGKHPHEWLRPIVESWNLVPFIDNAYLAWFGVMFAANGFCLFFDRDSARRLQYLWSFNLCWIVSGTVAAFIFSSCGPVFFHLFYPDMVDPYSGLSAWLATARNGEPVDTSKVSAFLYDMTTDDVLPDLNGISAMPSQHVAMAWLIALYARRFWKIGGEIAFLYAVLILIGSVILGWHYALDGYLGIVLAQIIWHVAGVITRRTTTGSAQPGTGQSRV